MARFRSHRRRRGRASFRQRPLRRRAAATHRRPPISDGHGELRNCAPSGLGDRYNLEGAVTFHGVTRAGDGDGQRRIRGHRLVITGEQVLDIRDFAIPSPTVPMLRIYPDVRVRLQVEAEPEDAP